MQAHSFLLPSDEHVFGAGLELFQTANCTRLGVLRVRLHQVAAAVVLDGLHEIILAIYCDLYHGRPHLPTVVFTVDP